MASIEQHNNLLKCMVGGQNHFRHILTNDRIREMTIKENRYPITRLPVCEHCERLAMWSKNINGERVGVCKCGTVTANPMRYSEYLMNGYDIDRTNNKVEANTEIQARKIIL